MIPLPLYLDFPAKKELMECLHVTCTSNGREYLLREGYAYAKLLFAVHRIDTVLVKQVMLNRF